ncbi:MAG: cupin domain-containing protein [Gammaproteobacteria bacterium]|nr:MAG: cupin domain-containing protein [Gammaproteobacteria bacterium]
MNANARACVLERDERPWGWYEVYVDAPDHKVKRILVRPGARLSLQRHHHREEHWYVVAGEGRAWVDEARIPVRPGVAVDIPREAMHRMENTGDTDLVFIEVQRGDYFGEDDIERFEDDYGRA